MKTKIEEKNGSTLIGGLISYDFIKQFTDEKFKEGGYSFSIITVKVNDKYLTKVSYRPDDTPLNSPYLTPIVIDKKEYQVKNISHDDVVAYKDGDYFKNEIYPNIKKDINNYFEDNKLRKYIKDKQ